MLRDIVVLVVVLALSTGCETRGPQYTVERGGPSLQGQQAERVLIEKIAQLLGKQIDPPLDKPLTALSLHLPPYPEDVRRANITGKVRIRFKVESTGTVSSPTIVGAPPPILAALVVGSMLSWRFEPITRNGQPIDLWLIYEYVYVLK